MDLVGSENNSSNPIAPHPLGVEITDTEFLKKMDGFSLESIVELKIARFFQQIGTYYPENLYDQIINKVEKSFLKQTMKRVGGNQVHAAKILGINRNTLRKKLKTYKLD